ncbi:ABC transporter substrate-binding protein [Pseudonocardia alni]|uniref:ABC transporter substrate-binding protein n=1 Tax=Pseudonocardia alni TaxID=33907 RepID=UPI001AD6C935|nr:ABC transporter substrate-binding protein [Pseudonocardia alni]MBO4236265.1 substrate-binding domain-containing protein [Pseudonocardia alni]
MSTTTPTPTPPTGRRVFRRLAGAAAAIALTAGIAACGSGGSGGAAPDTLTLGFAQVGAESGWRTANTASIQESAKQAGIELQFSDGQQKQENQIKAIRSFIQQQVDVIAFSPVVETGWDTVLQEAKRARIPVVLTDRSIDSADPSLVKSFIGSDFVKEGQKAGEWLVKDSAGKPEVNVVELQGTTGAAPAIDRTEGFKQATAGTPAIKVVASQTGDFTRSGGKQVMEAFLKSQPKIDVVYAQNDDMALGAIEAITAAGRVPGKDITIISVDATKDGMQATADGKINYMVECNPLLGGQLMDMVKKVAAGEQVPARVEVTETTFDQAQAAAVLAERKY